MNKPTCIIYGSIDTYSGYGARARDVAKAIIELKKDEWDIKIMACRWGSTPMKFIDNNPEWSFLNDYILVDNKLDKQPDYMFWITVPNEVQAVAKYNVLITAGIESTIAPADWVEGCQRMDLVLGSSQHTIDVLKNSKFEKKHPQTNQTVGIAEWTKEGKTLIEGVNLDMYNVNKNENFDLSSISESFCYLFTGHWIGNAPIGEDRKNVGLLIKAFYETFKNKSQKPALILKVSMGSSSYMDRDEIFKRIEAIKASVKAFKLPNVYLLHGELTDNEMADLYNHPKVKAMISLTKGEGWGRPLLEFSVTGKPIIATNYSGHIDYLKADYTTLLPGELKNIHPSAANNMLLKEAQWFNVDLSHVNISMKHMFEYYSKYLEKSKKQGKHSRENFSYENMKQSLNDIVNTFPTFSQQLHLKLPPLTLPKLKQIS